jgi:hypothetical protein
MGTGGLVPPGGAELLSVNDTLFVRNPSDILEKESGLFLVSSPTGEVKVVVCSPGGACLVKDTYHLPEAVRTDSFWRITKIGDEFSVKLGDFKGLQPLNHNAPPLRHEN